MPPTTITGKEREMILLEGNIGAGKSTLGEMIKSTNEFAFIPEPVTSWQKDFPDNLLGLFYQDSKRWAFTFQIVAFITRAKTWTEVLAMTNHSRVILERSIYCDRNVFAKNCFEESKMSRTEWLIYCRLWDWLQSHWCVEPDKIIYLRTPAELCLKRLQERERKEEVGIPLGYLKDLERLHDDWLLGNAKAIIIDGVKEPKLILTETIEKLQN